jgi:TonB family protein
MGRTILALAPLAATLAPAAARAQDAEAIVLEPSSPWNATYDDGRCRLARMFVAGGQQHALVFEQAAPEARFNMSVAGPGLTEIDGDQPLQLAFGPDGATSDQESVKEASPEFGTVVFLKDISLNPAALAEAKAGEGVGFSAGTRSIDTADAEPLRQISLTQGGLSLVFQTGPLAAPFNVLNDCTAHIVTTWGLNADVQRNAQRIARLRNELKVARAMQSQYPRQALMRNRGGVVGLAMLVDVAGVPTECRIIYASGEQSLDAAACDELMKARYDPGLDAQGQPVKAYWTTRVTYRTN